MDIVSIKKLELSDMSSNEDEDAPAVPHGLRREIRRLPLKKGFEFVRRSVDSMSSFGIGKHDSVASLASAEPEIGGPVQEWQVNALVDSLSDDEEAGDVEAALRNLEGRISHVKQMVKQVDNWIHSICDRLINGDYGDEQLRFPPDDQDSEDQTSENSGRGFGDLNGDPDSDHLSSPASTSYAEDPPRASPSSEGSRPVVNEHSKQSWSGPASPLVETKPLIEDAVPLEILRSRVSPRPSTAGGSIFKSADPRFNTLMKYPSLVFIGPHQKLSRKEASIVS
jgi:Gdp/GTP exchange factor required for growth at low temperatures